MGCSKPLVCCSPIFVCCYFVENVCNVCNITDIDKYLLICKRFVLLDNRNNRKGGDIVISYEPLWRTMKEKDITTYTLIYKHNFSPYTITNLKRNKSITMNTLERLCKILNCQAESVVIFEPGE